MKRFFAVLAFSLAFGYHAQAQAVPTQLAAMLTWNAVICPPSATGCQFGVFSKSGACPSGAVANLAGWTEIAGMPASELSYEDKSPAQGSTTAYVVVTYALQPTGPPFLSAPSNCAAVTLSGAASPATTLTITVGPA